MLIRRTLLVLLFLSCALSAQERVDVGTPIVKTITTWRVNVFSVKPEQDTIFIQVIANTGETRDKSYTGPVGRTLISGLNTANLTTRSLYQRILDRLIADGVIAGTVAGTPR
jgi:hypothetical protein